MKNNNDQKMSKSNSIKFNNKKNGSEVSDGNELFSTNKKGIFIYSSTFQIY